MSAVPAIKIIWDWINEGTDGKGDPEGEEQSQGENEGDTQDKGECLALTNLNNGEAYMTTCGANGTVWIAVPHNDGYALYSRWWYDNGYPNENLAAASASNNAALFAYNGFYSGFWQTWSWPR